MHASVRRAYPIFSYQLLNFRGEVFSPYNPTYFLWYDPRKETQTQPPWQAILKPLPAASSVTASLVYTTTLVNIQ